MKTTYVLIDYENVQPRNLEVLESHPLKVLVFVGANQAKVPFDLAYAMQKLGDKAHYVKITGNGQNALDFHIAYYIGKLSVETPDASFHVISRDTGFDPLIKHLQTKGLEINREKDLVEIPALRISTATSSSEKIAAILKNLSGLKQSRPRKVKTLSNTINSLFTKQLDEGELTSLINELQEKKYISVNQNNVSYNLPQ